MIERYYEVSCDFCGLAMNHYKDVKPTREELEKDGFVCTPTKQFCTKECYENWNYDRLASQYTNLKQKGKVHGM